MKNGKLTIEIRQRSTSDDEWVKAVLKKYWYSTRIISKGRIHEADKLPGFIAQQNNIRVGLILYEIIGNECEIVSLNSFTELAGVGSQLIEIVRSTAAKAQCRRVWLITTNDNTHALRFYQERGFVLSAIHLNAIRESRRLKPELPIIGHDSIPIRDEIELEFLLQKCADQDSRGNPRT